MDNILSLKTWRCIEVNNKDTIDEVYNKLISDQEVEGISDIIKKNDIIVVGLSGGADSVALTYFLYKISENFKLKIIGCHINHGIRGEEANSDQKFVRDFCNKLGINLLEKTVNLPSLLKKSNKSSEELGREIRYQFFNECGNKYNAKIATAHNMNDNVETVILNLIRGTGIKGLCGIPRKRDNIIRPFINFTRQDIEKYCEDNSLSFVTDSSNLTSDYSRNIIRNEMVPIISKINPNFTSTINRNCGIILEDELYLSKKTEEFLKNISIADGYSISRLSRYSNNIKNRLIQKILKLNDLPYSYQKIKIILEFLYKDNKKSSLIMSNDKYIYKAKDFFKIKNIEKSDIRDNGNNFDYSLDDDRGKRYVRYEIRNYDDMKDIIKKDKSILKRCVDYDKVVGELRVRNRRDGDKIRISYRNVTKSLKKLFNEEKILIKDRDKISVVYDDVGIIWVHIFGANERVEVGSDTKRILFLIG